MEAGLPRLLRVPGVVSRSTITTTPDGAVQTVAAIAQRGGEAFAVHGDVRSAGAVKAMVDEVVERTGALDILVNNAGVQTWKPFLDVTEAEWDLVIDTNLKGCFLCTQAAARHMKARGRGTIVNIGSGCNKVPFPKSRRLHGQQGRHRDVDEGRGRGARAARDPRELRGAWRHRNRADALEDADYAERGAASRPWAASACRRRRRAVVFLASDARRS